MPLIKVNNTNLNIQQVGSKINDPIIMLHGLLVGNLAMWYFTASPRLAKNHWVIMYDLRGHGRSDKKKTGYDIETMVSDLDGLIQHLGISTFSLVGHSYGALIALHYALKNQKKIKKLALIEAPLPPSKMNEADAFMDKSPEEMVDALPDWMREMLMQGKRQALKFLKSLAFLAKESSLLTDLENEKDISNNMLNTLNIPTLLIYGNDSLCRHVGDRLKNEIHNSKLVNLAGGHYLPLEKAEDVTTNLEEFFSG